MNINRRLRDNATTVSLTAVERRRVLDTQGIIETAARVLDNKHLAELASKVGVFLSLVDGQEVPAKKE